MAFSQGACLAATYIVRQSRAGKPADFKCAVFLSGVNAVDPSALEAGEIRHLNAAVDGEVITVPVANVWASNDERVPGMSKELGRLCCAATRMEFVHEDGHNVPKGKEEVIGAVRPIRRVIDVALRG